MRHRNKKINRNARFNQSSVCVVGAIILALAGTMIYYSLNSCVSSISQEIGQKENRLKALEQDLDRVTVRWNQMTTSDRLDEQLKHFGLDMRIAVPGQRVKLGADGKPSPGQLSVARLTGVSQVSRMAQNDTRRRGQSHGRTK